MKLSSFCSLHHESKSLDLSSAASLHHKSKSLDLSSAAFVQKASQVLQLAQNKGLFNIIHITQQYLSQRKIISLLSRFL